MHGSILRGAKSISNITLIGLILLTASCSADQPATTPEILHVQYTNAAQPWLEDLNECAGTDIVSVEFRAANHQDPKAADMVIRVGQPETLTGPAWQIDTDDLLVIVNPQNPITSLTTNQVVGLFTGQIDNWKDVNGTNTPIHVWVFPEGEDVQQIFEKTILGYSPLTSTARLAINPEEMSLAISNDDGAIGIITHRWKSTTTQEVFIAANDLPVLAITQADPEGTIAQTLACMQK